jgi:hypothetical protein
MLRLAPEAQLRLKARFSFSPPPAKKMVSGGRLQTITSRRVLNPSPGASGIACANDATVKAKASAINLVIGFSPIYPSQSATSKSWRLSW